MQATLFILGVLVLVPANVTSPAIDITLHRNPETVGYAPTFRPVAYM
jgi:hypothetical protein